jgi:transposase
MYPLFTSNSAKQLGYGSRIIQIFEEAREKHTQPKVIPSTKQPKSEKSVTLTDKEWEAIRPYVEQKGIGRWSQIDKRIIAEAIRYVLIAPCSWRELPERYPNWKTVYDYYGQWKRHKRWKDILKVLKQGKRRRLVNQSTQVKRDECLEIVVLEVSILLLKCLVIKQ